MTRWTRSLLLVLPLLVAVTACEGDSRGRRDLPGERGTPTSPTAPTPAPALHRFEFRVLGDPGSVETADIRWATTQEGTTLVASQLPWFTTVRTAEGASFLSLSARQTQFSTGFLHVQIFVNGALFREASAPGPNATVSIAGSFVQ